MLSTLFYSEKLTMTECIRVTVCFVKLSTHKDCECDTEVTQGLKVCCRRSVYLSHRTICDCLGDQFVTMYYAGPFSQRHNVLATAQQLRLSAQFVLTAAAL